LCEHRFDLLVQGASDGESFAVSIGSQEAGYAVVGEMDAVSSLVDQNGHWGVGTGVRGKLDHLFHDQEIARDDFPF
jgi:hypothetical protein